MAKGASDDKERVVILSSAKPAVVLGATVTVIAVSPAALAMYGWLSGGVPLAIVAGACAWSVLSASFALYAINQLRTVVELRDDELFIRRPFGSTKISAKDVDQVVVREFRYLGPMRPTWLGDAMARVDCRDGRRARFIVSHSARPDWSSYCFRRLFV